MQHTKIEWVKNIDGSPGYSWNPIKGLCPVACFYCYARRIYQRFKLDPEIRLDLDELMTDFPQKPSRIFACSTFELFHPVADPYRNNVFKHISLTPEHTFIILTKMPERIDRPMPENVWLGTSIPDSLADHERAYELLAVDAKVKFISFEPLLSEYRGEFPIKSFSWIIVGRLTGHGHKFDPSRRTVEGIFNAALSRDVPVFLKNNLRGIWPEPLIQEFPKEKP